MMKMNLISTGVFVLSVAGLASAPACAQDEGLGLMMMGLTDLASMSANWQYVGAGNAGCRAAPGLPLRRNQRIAPTS